MAWTALLGAAFASLSAHAAGSTEQADFDSLAPGTSIVGAGKVRPDLHIETSGGNDVVVVKQGLAPTAYGGGTGNESNGCLGAGFADIGSPRLYTSATKKHQYVFHFTTPVSSFSVRMRDWGDFLPYGANGDQTYAMVATAYDTHGDVVDTNSIAFTTAATSLIRDSNEFGNLRIAGDGCDAQDGQPGNYRFQLEGEGITRITLQPRDQASTDPHIAFAELQFTPEIADQDEDGVPDDEDACPESATTVEVPNVVIGAHTTSVRNVNDVSGPGCSIQDLVNGITRKARNHGHLVNGIKALADWLVSRGYATPAQSRELHQAASHKKGK